MYHKQFNCGLLVEKAKQSPQDLPIKQNRKHLPQKYYDVYTWKFPFGSGKTY